MSDALRIHAGEGSVIGGEEEEEEEEFARSRGDEEKTKRELQEGEHRGEGG